MGVAIRGDVIVSVEQHAPSKIALRRAFRVHLFLAGLAIILAAYFFLKTDDVVWADIYLFGFLAAGELAGRGAAHLIKSRPCKRGE